VNGSQSEPNTVPGGGVVAGNPEPPEAISSTKRAWLQTRQRGSGTGRGKRGLAGAGAPSLDQSFAGAKSLRIVNLFCKGRDFRLGFHALRSIFCATGGEHRDWLKQRAIFETKAE
jgi:hypothetical protein